MSKPIAPIRRLPAAVMLSCLCFVPVRAPAQTADPATATVTYTEVARKQVELTDQKLKIRSMQQSHGRLIRRPWLALNLRLVVTDFSLIVNFAELRS